MSKFFFLSWRLWTHVVVRGQGGYPSVSIITARDYYRFPSAEQKEKTFPCFAPVSLVVEIISFSLLPFFFFFIPSQPEVKLARDIGERKVGGRGWFSRSFICRVLWVTGRIFAGPRNKFTDDLYGWLNETSAISKGWRLLKIECKSKSKAEDSIPDSNYD